MSSRDASFIKLGEGKGSEEKGRLFDIRTVKNIFANQTVRTVSLTILCLLFLDGATSLLLIVETQTLPEKADFYYGAVTTIKGLGMALASVGVYGWLSHTKKSYIHLLCFLSYFKILLIYLMGQVTIMTLFLLIVFVEAYLWISITIIEKFVMQSVFPASDRAKTFAIYGSMCWLSSSAGTLFFGFLSEKIGLPKAVMMEAVIVFIVLLIIHYASLRSDRSTSPL